MNTNLLVSLFALVCAMILFALGKDWHFIAFLAILNAQWALYKA